MSPPLRRTLEFSIERGAVARLLGRLPPPHAAAARLRLRRLLWPARMGSLRRVTPLSHDFGYDRGTPVDRYYIERFLHAHRADVRGRVLEVQDDTYTKQFGSAVTQSDVIDIDASNPRVTVVADLAAADDVPGATFDCFILTQTLQLIFDVEAAVGHAHRMLRPGGVLLVTLPVTSPVVDDEHLIDYWRFTRASCERLFERVFGQEAVNVRAHGNLLTSIAFLAGMAHEELSPGELEFHDERFPLLMSVRAVKR